MLNWWILNDVFAIYFTIKGGTSNKDILLASSIFKAENLETRGFPGGASGKESACQCKRCKKSSFDPCIGKILWVANGDPL